MILVEQNSGAQYELRSWQFLTDQLAFSFFRAIDVEMSKDKADRTNGISAYRIKSMSRTQNYVVLVGQVGAIDQIDLPRPMGGAEVELEDEALVMALLQRRLRSEAEAAFDHADQDENWVDTRRSYGHGTILTRDGEVVE